MIHMIQELFGQTLSVAAGFDLEANSGVSPSKDIRSTFEQFCAGSTLPVFIQVRAAS